MKNNLLFTTAMAVVAFAISDASAARLVVAAGENAKIEEEMSANKDAALQGGAVLNTGKLTVADGVSFLNNEGSVGGAVSSVDSLSETVIGNNVSFIGNQSAMQGGAFHNQRMKSSVGDNVKFLNNTAIGYGGGAVYQDTDGVEAAMAIGENAEFSKNSSQVSHGGAIMNFNANEGAVVTLGKNAVFSENTAGKTGGAISNWAGSVTLEDGSSFNANSAATNGGAVYNSDYYGNGVVTFKGNTVFKNNTSGEQGGAIFNDGTINIKNAVFANNKANGKLNDIHNEGKLNIDGNVVLDGGISGAGTTTFAEGAKLTVRNGVTTISNRVVNNGAELALNFDNEYDGGKYTLIVDGGSLDKEFSIAENALYDIKSEKNGSYVISKKETSNIADITGADRNQLAAISVITSGTTGDRAFDKIAEDIGYLLQSPEKSGVKQALNAITALAPNVAPVVQHTQTATLNQVYGAVSTRLSGGSVAAGSEGLSSGDNVFERAAVWIQGLLNKAKLDKTSKSRGFDADTHGVAFGLEKFVTDGVKAGIGYAYSKTDIDGFMRDTDVDTHTAMVYSEYKPSQWYVNTIASYSWSDYSDKANVVGHQVKSDYDVDTIGIRVMSGYDMQIKGGKITPEAGLRYVHLKQDGYRDSAAQKVSANKSDILTGVVGIAAGKEFALENGTTLRPEARVAVTYDMATDNAGAIVTLANGSAYSVKGDKLKRFGMEFGAGVKADIRDDVELSLGYEGKFRKDYQDHTGLLNLKYKF